MAMGSKKVFHAVSFHANYANHSNNDDSTDEIFFWDIAIITVNIITIIIMTFKF